VNLTSVKMMEWLNDPKNYDYIQWVLTHPKEYDELCRSKRS
jgi:hypothetical protein